MSPRAASRLADLGFLEVYDYAAGIADWASFGLPIEGEHASGTRVGAHARTDVPACPPSDRMIDVREKVRAGGWDTCFVTDEHGVVLGRLGRTALAADDDVSVEQAMTLGPEHRKTSEPPCPELARRRQRVVDLEVAREMRSGRVGRAVPGDPEPLDVGAAKPKRLPAEKKMCARLRDKRVRDRLRGCGDEKRGGGNDQLQDVTILGVP